MSARPRTITLSAVSPSLVRVRPAVTVTSSLRAGRSTRASGSVAVADHRPSTSAKPGALTTSRPSPVASNEKVPSAAVVVAGPAGGSTVTRAPATGAPLESRTTPRTTEGPSAAPGSAETRTSTSVRSTVSLRIDSRALRLLWPGEGDAARVSSTDERSPGGDRDLAALARRGHDHDPGGAAHDRAGAAAPLRPRSARPPPRPRSARPVTSAAVLPSRRRGSQAERPGFGPGRCSPPGSSSVSNCERHLAATRRTAPPMRRRVTRPVRRLPAGTASTPSIRTGLVVSAESASPVTALSELSGASSASLQRGPRRERHEQARRAAQQPSQRGRHPPRRPALDPRRRGASPGAPVSATPAPECRRSEGRDARPGRRPACRVPPAGREAARPGAATLVSASGSGGGSGERRAVGDDTTASGRAIAQGLDHLGPGGVACRRVLRHRAAQDGVDPARQAGAREVDERRLLAQDLHQDGGDALALERLPAGEALVEHAAEREEIRPPVHLQAPGLLGRHVVRACP